MKKHAANAAPIAAATPENKPTAAAKPPAAAVGAKPSEEAIRMCAYQRWEAAGRPACDGVQFWLEAEQEMIQKK